MPEGPEIRRSADAIASVLNGQLLTEVQAGLPALKSMQHELQGQRVLRVTSWGKAMLVHLENALTIYSHNQLYGVWYVTERGQQPQTKRSLRLGLHTEQHSAVLYSASDISIWPTQQLIQQPVLAKLGPDVLSDGLVPEKLVERLVLPRFKNKKLSGLLLDQGFIAGIGNYLRSEILFRAGLLPDTSPGELCSQQLFRLARAILEVSWQSYHTGGYTVDEQRYQKSIATRADYEQSRFWVFDRAGLPCRVCGNLIERTERQGRRLYWCQVCQTSDE